MRQKRGKAQHSTVVGLLDLAKYEVEKVERVPGWGRLFLKLKRSFYPCPGCRQVYIFIQSRRWRILRDLDVAGRHIELAVPVVRIRCSTCGLRELPVRLARPNARCTKRLERDLFRLTKDMTVKAVSERMDVHWETVKDAEVRYIRGLLRKRKLDGIRRIGIDEVSHQHGQRYLTLVTDLDHRRVIFVTPDHDGRSIGRFLDWFGEKRCARLEVVVTDMHDPYVKVLRARLPKAALVYDHFHVSKAIHAAIDEIRRRLQNQMSKEDRDIVKGKRWVLLRARETLSDRQEVSLQELMEVNKELAQAYILKEDFRWAFKAATRAAGEKRLGGWEAKARECGIPEIQAVLKTIEHRREGIMNFFEYQVANGMAEGFNNVVGTIKKQAYGFHDREYLMLKILRICGKLDSDTLMRKSKPKRRMKT
jgi:transposase